MVGNFELFKLMFNSLVEILPNKVQVVRLLLYCRKALYGSDATAVLNRLYIEDYIVYVQQINVKRLEVLQEMMVKVDLNSLFGYSELGLSIGECLEISKELSLSDLEEV
ncbi:hypothetical protein RCL1_000644 [Eukaryota sp. TZLM3-RCL]